MDAVRRNPFRARSRSILNKFERFFDSNTKLTINLDIPASFSPLGMFFFVKFKDQIFLISTHSEKKIFQNLEKTDGTRIGVTVWDFQLFMHGALPK